VGDSPTGYHLRFLQIPGAELATIIFALHPVNVETVDWIAERKNTLSGVFGLAATLWYLRFDESRSGRSYAMSCGGLETPFLGNLTRAEMDERRTAHRAVSRGAK